MRFGVVLYNLGKVCLVLAVSMVLPIGFEVVSKEAVMGSLVAAQMVMLGLGLLFLRLFRYDKRTTLRYRALRRRGLLFCRIWKRCRPVF